MKGKTSLPAYLAEHRKQEKASFHMPGHKGSSLFARFGYEDLIRDTAGLDITEIPGADDLREPSGVIKAAADRYSELYGSLRSFLSVNGSSALIMAAIMSQVRRGHRVIASSDSHISVRNGIRLAGAEAVYADPEMLDADKLFRRSADPAISAADVSPQAISAFDVSPQVFSAPGQIDTGKEPGIPGGMSADVIGALLDEYDDVDAVIFPSPNYFGIVSDVKSIAEEVHKRGKVLIVDQAHGAHLKMFSHLESGLLPVPAEECAADIVIDSTHKTMASFTQSAAGHIFGDRVDPDDFERALLTLESTSPSYVLMDSLAVNAEIMSEHGDELAAGWRQDLDWFYSEVKTIPGIRVLTRDAVKEAGKAYGADFDDSKIVLDFSGLGMDGKQAEVALMEKGIYPEFHSGSIVMCLTGIGNVRKDYELLIGALRDVSRGAGN